METLEKVELKTGDVVTNGQQKMTVTRILPDGVECTWFEQGEDGTYKGYPQKGIFKPETLLPPVTEGKVIPPTDIGEGVERVVGTVIGDAVGLRAGEFGVGGKAY